MEWVETTGRSVDEAKDAALDELGVDVADAEFEVLEEAKSGLFGRVRQEARVRARVRPTTPRPKVERRDRKRRAGAGNGVAETPTAGDGDVEASEAAPELPVKAARPTRAKRPAAKEAAPAPRVGVGGRGDEGVPVAPVSEDLDDDVDHAEEARRFLDGLVGAFAVAGASVDVEEVEEDTLEARVVGDDLGLLIGPKAQTLEAVQELLRAAVQRSSTGRGPRLRVDIGGYRQRRRGALERFTKSVADQVLSSGASVALEPMAPADRKVVHDTANDIDGIATTSEGVEPRRRVVVLVDDDGS